MNKIIIYSNETCPYCKQIKEELKKNDIVFENRLTTEHVDEWQAVIALTGMPTVPTILYEGDHLVPARDFRNSQHLIDILKNYKKSAFSTEEITLQQLKTLAYNIQIAFGRTNQILTQIENKLKTEDDEHESTN